MASCTISRFFFLALVLGLLRSVMGVEFAAVDPNNSTAVADLKLPDQCKDKCLSSFTNFLQPTCQSDPTCKCTNTAISAYADCASCLIAQNGPVMNSEGRKYSAVTNAQATVANFAADCKAMNVLVNIPVVNAAGRRQMSPGLVGILGIAMVTAIGMAL